MSIKIPHLLRAAKRASSIKYFRGHLSRIWLPVSVAALLVGLYLLSGKSTTNAALPELNTVSEMAARHASFGELSAYFKTVAQTKGAAYAFDLLRAAPLPADTDLHLLGHTIGDVLYKQQGAQGIKICTDEFRNACSHSIVVGLFSDKGEAALPEIDAACHQAPGGSGAYTMCFHGLGHGIFAYTGYDLPKTVGICQKTGSAAFSNSEIPQCISGAVMEIISGGGHDHDLWVAQRPKYLNVQDPLSPCNKDYIPASAKVLCYIYLTPFLFEAAGTDPYNPDPSHFAKAFSLCSPISDSEKDNRLACYGGFGKDLIVLANHKDIRRESLVNMPDSSLKQTIDWCKLAGREDGTAACIENATNSLYWGGENDYHVSLRFCSLADSGYYQDDCYSNLITNVYYYMADPSYREQFCSALPSRYLSECQSKSNAKPI